MATEVEQTVERLRFFVNYVTLLKGDEKGEAQVFCDRLFQAFGHLGYKEAGAVLEDRIKVTGKRGTSFADLVWKPRLLLEMKKRGENLRSHYRQAFDYWIHAVPDRPRYVVLCNFDEFWIYDFDRQIDRPVDVMFVADLPQRYSALSFLFPTEQKPIFGNDLEAVTRAAADKVARVFSAMVKRGVKRTTAQRLILQCVVAMFAEDIELMPRGTVFSIMESALNGASSFDLLGSLFRQMDSPTEAPAGRFVNIPYFNGGLFSAVDVVELERIEAILLAEAAKEDWSKVNPAIFGTLFQNSMDAAERHALGAHFTSEADILRVVKPTIVKPWETRIESCKKASDALSLRDELHAFKVLDPACGSGNFLYVAYREMVRLEILIVEKLREVLGAKEFEKKVKNLWLIGPSQFYGIERDTFGIELAKVTLTLAKKLALDEMRSVLGREQIELPLDGSFLPLDNLDANFICGDALFVDWPGADAIIGNPPYQSKNKMIGELGRPYVNSVRLRYPDVPGRADYCVYWFRRAHDELAPGKRAGLVGTNTIRQNYSREGGLDYIVKNGGTITEAVSTQVWSGEAVVHVSIVNWLKGEEPGKKKLFRQVGDHVGDPWELLETERIGAALSFDIDVTQAKKLKANAAVGGCFQGQTHGNDGFLLEAKDGATILKSERDSDQILRPYLIADDILEHPEKSMRYVIDFGSRSMPDSQRFKRLFDIVERRVLDDKKKAAENERKENEEAVAANAKAVVRKDHANALKFWWRLFRGRAEMLAAIRQLPRYIVCSRVTKRPIFEFVSSEINPNDALMVFPYVDDYSYGILQSSMHWIWFTNRCSTMKADPRYTSNTIFDTFPWPQAPSEVDMQRVATRARELRSVRRQLQASGRTLREMYRDLEKPGDHPLRNAHQHLDRAVRLCYGLQEKGDPLTFILALNSTLSEAETAGVEIRGPGLDAKTQLATKLSSTDCLLPFDGYRE